MAAGKSSTSGGGRGFGAFLATDWQRWVSEYPELATMFGVPGFNDRWTDDSPEGIAKRKHHLEESLVHVRQIDRRTLAPADRLNYDLYRGSVETAHAGVALGHDPWPFNLGWPRHLRMPLNQMDGIHVGAPDVLTHQPRQRPQEYADLLARLARLSEAVDQNLALMKEGLAAGYTPPKIAIRTVPGQVEGLLPSDPAKSPLLEPFSQVPATFSPADRERLVAEATRIFKESVAPAFSRLHEYLVSEYVPACRDSVGASELPDGMADYHYLVRYETTTDLTPEQVHEIGQREVRRIRDEMETLIASTGFSGSFAEFCQFLRTDPRFFYQRPEELVDGFRVIGKCIEPNLPRLFGRLPRLPYGVLPVPSFKAAGQPTAYYLPGAPAVGRAGYFYANTYKLDARPRWLMEALTLHEAVPGHHLQIAIAQEAEDIPDFRKHTGATAYTEGWGLYAESLGEELGCYQDPYARFGGLSADMWRSVRLVVDTGMHALGWSRDQALAFFRDNTGSSEQDIVAEVDRYLVIPAQALAYKIGQLKLRELRTLAEKELGARFDVRAFHDLVLGEGALPLGLLEARVREWVEGQRGSAAA